MHYKILNLLYKSSSLHYIFLYSYNSFSSFLNNFQDLLMNLQLLLSVSWKVSLTLIIWSFPNSYCYFCISNTHILNHKNSLSWSKGSMHSHNLNSFCNLALISTFLSKACSFCNILKRANLSLFDFYLFLSVFFSP